MHGVDNGVYYENYEKGEECENFGGRNSTIQYKCDKEAARQFEVENAIETKPCTYFMEAQSIYLCSHEYMQGCLDKNIECYPNPST